MLNQGTGLSPRSLASCPVRSWYAQDPAPAAVQLSTRGSGSYDTIIPKLCSSEASSTSDSTPFPVTQCQRVSHRILTTALNTGITTHTLYMTQFRLTDVIDAVQGRRESTPQTCIWPWECIPQSSGSHCPRMASAYLVTPGRSYRIPHALFSKAKSTLKKELAGMPIHNRVQGRGTRRVEADEMRENGSWQ